MERDLRDAVLRGEREGSGRVDYLDNVTRLGLLEALGEGITVDGPGFELAVGRAREEEGLVGVDGEGPDVSAVGNDGLDAVLGG